LVEEVLESFRTFWIFLVFWGESVIGRSAVGKVWNTPSETMLRIFPIK